MIEQEHDNWTKQEKEVVDLFKKYAKSNKLYDDVPSIMKKLGEEIFEFVGAVMRYNRNDAAEEAADIYILLIDILERMGSEKGITKSVEEKLKVLEERWSQQGQIGRNR